MSDSNLTEQPPTAQDDQDDLLTAVRYAQGLLGGDSDARVAAQVSLLLSDLGSSNARLVRARELGQQTLHSDANDVWVRQACQLLNKAIERLAEAGATTPEAEAEFRAALQNELHPEHEPFHWDRARRTRFTWWLRRIGALRARIVYEPQPARESMHRLSLYIGHRKISSMKYLVCDQCMLALVGKIDIYERYKGLGLGTRAVLAAYRKYPKHEWHTTAQYETSGSFWPTMSARTGAAFTQRQPCEHM